MDSNHISRRQALKQTFGFSAALLLGRASLFGQSEGDAEMEMSPTASHFTMIGDWGRHDTMALQTEVANSMIGYLKEKEIQPDAMFFLGDNFYGKMNGGVKSSRFRKQFSEVYPRSSFPGPCYAILGNHEYDDQYKVKIEAQIGYNKSKPGTRWNMPNKWYRVDFGPKEAPLMTTLFLDSNFKNRRDQLTAEERIEQKAWLITELEKPRTAPWLVVNGHHPLYSNGAHGDTPEVIEEWDALFRKHKVHFYFCGHDHDLQHLQFEGHPTSFVLSGGGGANIRQQQQDKRDAPFSEAVAGFTHLEVTTEKCIVRHVNEEGKLLHAFWKKPDGTWRVMG
ncbi:metallophosphoesterase [Akkermansiaceae bacterium]|nr:metallophosphoesterase [Akkermansiaceae bacterium]